MEYELYLKIENNKPVEDKHPVYAMNLMEVFGEIPEGYEPFVRKIPNELYKHVSPPAYEKVNGVWTDVVETTDFHDSLTEAEKYIWYKHPLDGRRHAWHPEEGVWVEIPIHTMPLDGKHYVFYVNTKEWVEFDPEIHSDK